MAHNLASTASMNAATLRLRRLAELDQREIEALQAAFRNARVVAAHREILAEGKPVGEASIVAHGWAARVRPYADGRRQILGYMLPGDLIGICFHRDPVAVTTIIAVTDVTLCPAPLPSIACEGGGLTEAYASSAALENAYLFRHIARLGRLSAYERLADWLLEMRERLALAGLAGEDQMPMPLTQEYLADTLGLTSVHVNRTLQAMRREGLLDVRSGMARFHDIERLRALVDYQPVHNVGS